MNGKTPGQIACETFYASFGTSIDWDDDQSAEHRAAWEAATGATIAEVVNPTAEDYDNAAEILQLRDLVAEILAEFGPSGSGHTARVGQVQIAKWRKRGGLENPK